MDHLNLLLLRQRLMERSLDSRGGPMLGPFIDLRNQGIEIDSTCGHQAQVIGSVALRVVLPHRLGRKGRYGILGSQHARRKGMLAEELLHRTLHRTVGGLIVIHGDLFENDLLLGLKILVAKRWAHHVRQEIQGRMLIVRQDTHVIDGLLLGGIGVGLGAQIIEFAIDIDRGSPGRTFEHHVFEEVAHTRNIHGLIAGPRFDKVP